MVCHVTLLSLELFHWVMGSIFTVLAQMFQGYLFSSLLLFAHPYCCKWMICTQHNEWTCSFKFFSLLFGIADYQEPSIIIIFWNRECLRYGSNYSHLSTCYFGINRKIHFNSNRNCSIKSYSPFFVMVAFLMMLWWVGYMFCHAGLLLSCLFSSSFRAGVSDVRWHQL